ncbi:MAG: 16S rRNA (uracil(1498)-N(3))-methyltransferase [Lachnospiraceae bacterium]|nr:16S rRNA (uracil(1498)-N(3))-methyltransferase [Lachnospiraceae bacterium]
MHHFFVDPSAVGGSELCITGADVNHIKNVLRLQAGEHITVSDTTGKEYTCAISRLTDAAVFAKIEDMQAEASELSAELYLFQGYPKGDKLEMIIQKTVELGVSKIIPVMTRRSIVRLDEKKAAKKQARYQAICEAAAKQSKRGVIPEVLPVMDFGEALKLAATLDKILIPYEDEKGLINSKKVINEAISHKKIGIFIGPEGGFDAAEVEAVTALGAHPVTLGHRILRTETAGLAIMAVIMFELECRQENGEHKNGSIF